MPRPPRRCIEKICTSKPEPGHLRCALHEALAAGRTPAPPPPTKTKKSGNGRPPSGDQTVDVPGPCHARDCDNMTTGHYHGKPVKWCSVTCRSRETRRLKREAAEAALAANPTPPAPPEEATPGPLLVCFRNGCSNTYRRSTGPGRPRIYCGEPECAAEIEAMRERERRR